MAAPKKVDYDSIEPEWIAGILSPEQLAQSYTKRTGVSVTRRAIIKHFEKAGIERDLKAKIRAKADAMVSASMMVPGKVSPATKNAIVDAVALSQATIRTEEMIKATDHRHALEAMIDELELQNEYKEELATLGEMMRNPDTPTDKLNDLYHKIISFGGRCGSAKSLMETWVKMVDAERKVHGIDVLPPDDTHKYEKVEIELIESRNNFPEDGEEGQ